MSDIQTTDIEQIETWIYQKLVSDQIILDFVGVHPTLNIYQIFNGKAPQGFKDGYVQYRWMGSSIAAGTGGRKIASTLSYLITLVLSGYSVKPMMAAYTRLEQLFQQDQMQSDSVAIGCQITNYLSADDDLAEDGIKYNKRAIQISVMAYNRVFPVQEII